MIPTLPPVAFAHGTLDDLWSVLTGDNVWQMSLRALFVYVFALALVRVGKSRMLSEATVFDIILMFVLGSMLSRVINGDPAVGPSLVAAAVLVAIHFVFGISAFHSHTLGNLIKGRANVLIQDGEEVDGAMHDHHLTQHDLEEALHSHGLTDIAQVKVARLERNGKISVVPRFHVIDIEVKEGVQRVRIEM